MGQNRQGQANPPPSITNLAPAGRCRLSLQVPSPRDRTAHGLVAWGHSISPGSKPTRQGGCWGWCPVSTARLERPKMHLHVTATLHMAGGICSRYIQPRKAYRTRRVSTGRAGILLHHYAVQSLGVRLGIELRATGCAADSVYGLHTHDHMTCLGNAPGAPSRLKHTAYRRRWRGCSSVSMVVGHIPASCNCDYAIATDLL